MRSRVSIEIDAKSVGQAFAYTDDKAQAEMLNEMAMELATVCHGDSGMQICALSKHLNTHAAKFIKSILNFMEMRKEDDA